MVMLLAGMKLTPVRTSNLLRMEYDVQSGYHDETETESENAETNQKQPQRSVQ